MQIQSLRIALGRAVLPLLAAPLAACAQSYPSRLVKVIVPLAAAGVQAIQSPGVRERLVQHGAEPVGNSAAEFRALWEREQVLWARVIRDSGAKAD